MLKERIEQGFHFLDLQPADLKDVWVEHRPWAKEWVEFRNISIKPGVKTRVQIVTSDDPPATQPDQPAP